VVSYTQPLGNMLGDTFGGALLGEEENHAFKCHSSGTSVKHLITDL